MSDKQNKLFDEFPPVSTEQWEARINADLKGADYEKKLVWKTIEGFNVRPYYRAEDLDNISFKDVKPGEFPFVRGNKEMSNDWKIRQDIIVDRIEEDNKKALFVLNKGVSSLGFICGKKKAKTRVTTGEQLAQLLKNIQYDCICLNFICGGDAPVIANNLYNETVARKYDPDKVNGSLDFDPLGELTFTGNFYKDEQTDLDEAVKLLKWSEKHLPDLRVLGINGYYFNNSGSSVVQELGFSLAIAADYLNWITGKGLTVDRITPRMQFNFGTGSNYFMEIAKIRAARLLWAKIVEAHHPVNKEAAKMFVHSVTSDWNRTIYDPYVNMLRSTTESMSSVLGGTDSLSVRPFDFVYKPTTKFSGRIARNIQILLKEESYFDKIVDPAAGSYYIENLTASIADEAWKLFLKTDENGGYIEAFKKGFVQEEIQKTVEIRNRNIATRREVLLGTNQYANPDEQVKEIIDQEISFPAEIVKGEVIAPPVKPYRGAMEFELLRLRTENYEGPQPHVFLFTYGDPVMRKARASFSTNFFACAGYKITDNKGFKTIDEGITAAKKSGAGIVVICSSDEEYEVIAPEISEKLKDQAVIVVAGAPSCMEELKEKGIKHFIHMKSNILESLGKFHSLLGI